MQTVDVHIDAAQGVSTAQRIVLHVVLVGVAVGDLGVQVRFRNDFQLAAGHNVVGQRADIIGGQHTGRRPEQKRIQKVQRQNIRRLEPEHAADENALVQRCAQDVPDGGASEQHRQQHREHMKADGRLVRIGDRAQIDPHQIQHPHEHIRTEGRDYMVIGEILDGADQTKADRQPHEIDHEARRQGFDQTAHHQRDEQE